MVDLNPQNRIVVDPDKDEAPAEAQPTEGNAPVESVPAGGMTGDERAPEAEPSRTGDGLDRGVYYAPTPIY